MTMADPTDRLSAKREFVLVLRLIAESDGKVRGELVDPLSQRRQRFSDSTRLADAVRAWIDSALAAVRESDSRATSTPTDT
jgi:hypothetical protein